MSGPGLSPPPSWLFRAALGAYGLAWKAAKARLSGHKRLRHGYGQRLVPDDWAAPATVWIQAASGGEAYLARALLRHLAAARNRAVGPPSLLLTSCTLQGFEILRAAAGEFSEAVGAAEIQVRYFPLDEPAGMARALSLAAPRAVLLLETELWPGLLWACKQAGTPVLVGNGRLTAKSLRNYRLLPAAWWDYLAPERILAVSRPDRDRFAALFGKHRVGMMPNIKFESLLGDAAGAAPEIERFFAPGIPMALFASVRKGEIRPVAEALALVQNGAPKAVSVLAPRHLHHVPDWEKALAGQGLAVKLRSLATEPFSAGDVVIWDRFGELKSLYALARAAFVGGSLAPLGGQNFMEALAQGLVPVMGPAWDNFAWAEDLAAPRGPAQVARTAPDVAAYILEQLKRQPDRAGIKKYFEKTVLGQQGGSAAVWELLGGYLFSPTRLAG